MKLTEFSIKYSQFIGVLVVLSVLLGGLSYINMPKSEDPALHLPMYYVIALYPGASSETMEKLVTTPLEESISEIDDMTKITSRSKDGITFIRLEGNFEGDPHKQHQEILRQVNAAREFLPEDIAYLRVHDIRPTSMYQMAITSEDGNYGKMLALAEKIERQVLEINGILQVSIRANPEEEIRVSLDFQKIAQLKIPLSDIIGLLQSSNAVIPGGIINAGNKVLNIKTSGGFESLLDIENTVIKNDNGRITYLKDIATVNIDYADQTYFARFNNTSAIYVNITPKFDVNILQINEKLLAIMEKEREQLPSGIELHTAFEQATAVSERISGFFLNLIKGVLVVGFIILLFLGARPSLIIMTIIPLSIIIAIGALDIAGFGIHQISIVGLVIALGLLVDNAIVVIENILFFQEKGYNLRDAALKGTSEVGPAIISSTATTVLAFYPLSQLGGAAGAFLKSMPLIVIFALVASLILALTFSPLLSSRFLKPPKPGSVNLQKFLEKFINGSYEKLLRRTLNKPMQVITIAISLLVASILLFPIVGVTFFPNADKPLLFINIKAPSGSNVEETDKAVKHVEALLDTSRLVKNYSSNIGNGNAYIYYNREVLPFGQEYGQIIVNLNEWNPREFYPFLGTLREHFDKYPHAVITTSELKNGPPIEAPITLKLLGDDLDTLKRYADKLANIMQNEKGVINIGNPRSETLTEVKVDINKDKAIMLGVLISDIDIAIKTCLSGYDIDNIILSNNKKYNLILRMPFEDKPTINDFEKIVVQSQSGENIPLLHLADIKLKECVYEIVHYKGRRCATLFGGLTDPDKTVSTTHSILDKFNKEELPEGMELSVSGELEGQIEAFGELYKSVLIVILGIFSVLVLQFKSFKQPLIIFVSLPLAFTGSIFALFVTGWSFSFFAFIGIVSLIGIVVNDSIILVDYINQLIEQGSGLIEGIVEASKKRFTSIVLTSLTTILGLLPLAFERSGLWSPLVWTIIGGMISCTFLTLLIVPLLYKRFSADKVEEKELTVN